MGQFVKHSHCSFCGTCYPAESGWPRRCEHCKQMSFLNPLPVAVLLQPVDEGLLLIRRNVPPRVGELALPGGYIDYGESWQQAAVRELREEAGVVVDPAGITLFDVHSAPDSTILIFGLAPLIQSSTLPAFVATNETIERVIINAPATLAFELHERAVARFFAE